MSKNLQQRHFLGYLCVFLAAASWGTGGVYVTHLTNLGASSFMTGFVEHFFAVPMLGLAILFSQGAAGFRISKRGLIYSVIMGMITKGCFKIAYDNTIATVGMSTGAVLLYTAPVFVAVMSRFIFKEYLHTRHYVALALNIIGVVLMVTLGDFNNLNLQPIGIALGLTAAFLYASNTVMAKIAGGADNALTMAFYTLFFSALIQSFTAQPWTAANRALFTQSSFLFWAVMKAFVTGAFANLLFLNGLSMDIDASKAPVVGSVEVIVATLMGVILFSEAINIVGVAGIFLIILSIYIMNRRDGDLTEIS